MKKYNALKYKKDITFSVIGAISIFIFLFLGNIFVFGKYDDNNFETFSTILIIVILWIGCSLISSLVGKKYTWQKHAIKKTIAISLSIIFLIFIVIMSFDLIPAYIHETKIDTKELRLSIIVMILITFGITSIAEASDIFKSWKDSILKTNRLEKENIEAQFNVLKNQIDPHFLFNSLNTLASYVQDNQKANEFIKNLSEFLRNTLVRKEENIISIREELELLNQYVFLQRARFKENLIVKIDIPDLIKEMGYVPPFTLQMLMENAVKHNIVSKAKPLTVEVYIEDERFLIIENNIQEKPSQTSTKLGLTNIIDRYHHLAGEQVTIEKNEEIFRVRIPVLSYFNSVVTSKNSI